MTTAVDLWLPVALELHLLDVSYRDIERALRARGFDPPSHVTIRKHVLRWLTETGVNPLSPGNVANSTRALPTSAIGDIVNPPPGGPEPFSTLLEPWDAWDVDDVREDIPTLCPMDGECDCKLPLFLVRKPRENRAGRRVGKKWSPKEIVPNHGLGLRTCPFHGPRRRQRHREKIERNHQRSEMAYGVFQDRMVKRNGRLRHERSPEYRAAVRYASEQRSRKRGEEPIPYVTAIRRSGLRLVIAPKILTPRKTRLPDGSRGFLMQETGNSLVLDGFELRARELRELQRMVSKGKWEEEKGKRKPDSYSLGYWTPELKARVEDALGVEYGDEITDEDEQEARRIIDAYWKERKEGQGLPAGTPRAA